MRIQRARKYPLITLCFSLLFALFSQTVFAQDIGEQPEDQTIRWDMTAERAQEALRNRRASDQAFGTLRDELAAQRAEAFAIIELGSIETKSIQAQLDALGPAPGKDETEHESVASRRAELSDAYAKANAPALAAKQAYQRANLFIEEIDKLLHERANEKLWTRYPSPLNPENWISAAQGIGAYLHHVGNDVRDEFSRPSVADSLGKRLTITLLLVLAAIGGFYIGSKLLSWLESRAESFDGLVHARFYAASAYLGSLLVPTVNAYLLIRAYEALGIAPNSVRSIEGNLPVIAGLFVLAYWLGRVLFSPSSSKRRIVALDDKTSAQAVNTCVALGGIQVLQLLSDSAESDFEFSGATHAVVDFLILALGAWMLFRLAGILRKSISTSGGVRETAAGEPVIGTLSRVMQIAAIASVALAVAGYSNLAQFAMFPLVLSFALLAFAVSLYRLIVIIFGSLVTENTDNTAGKVAFALFPVAASVIIATAMIPALALIWGARVSDISEAWILLNQGIEIGGIRISLKVVLVFSGVFVIGLIVTRWLQRLLDSSVLPRTRLDLGARNALLTGVGYVGVILSALVGVSMAGLDLSNFAIVAGALSVGLGFGMQAIVSNFVSGIILLVERPIKEGDWIEVSGHSGIVRKIAVRSTRIETFDRHSVILPNSDLIAGTVKNMTHDTKIGRVIVPVGVAYGSDLDTVRNVMLDAAKAHELVMPNPEPSVIFMGFGESSLDFELRCFVEDVMGVLGVKSDLLYVIYRELTDRGIEIPFPQRDINIRNAEEVLQPIAGSKPGARKSAKRDPDKTD